MLIRLRLFSAAAVLITLAGVQAQHRVTLSSQSLCVVTGSTVKIPCTFTTPDHSSITQREWYRVQRFKGEPQDLSKDPQYSGRVSVSTWWSDCELTLSNVRVSDSGVYNFRFKTQRSDWISASSGVRLTVTDVKVTVSDGYNGKKKLSCDTICPLSTNPTYIWYKNGQTVTDQDTYEKYLYVSKWKSGSYSCAVRGHEELHSPAVCVFNELRCLSVTYSTQTICSLIGSSVDIHSYYTFPHQYKVTKVFWFFKVQGDDEAVDLKEDEEYQGRVQYTQRSQNECRLRITNLTERDAQTYRFRMHIARGKYTGEPGVSLSVTDLKVTVSDRYSGKTLSCITSCTLPNNPTYIWYKNGQPVTDQYAKRQYLYVYSKESGSYSCAVRGHEELRSPAVYPPKNTRAEVYPSGYPVQGDSVTLSCSSDANPPVHTYSWFKQTAAAKTWLTTVQSYSINNISSQDSGLYYCTAYSQLGQQDSTPTHLDVLYSPKNIRAVVLSSGDPVEGDSVTLSCSSDANPPVLSYSWFKQTEATDTLLTTGQNYSISNISSQHSGLYYCTAHNQLGQQGSASAHLDVLYYPKNTRAVVLSSGDPVEGDSVTLNCSSDANPPVHTYSWFKQRASADTLLTTDQNYNISNISSQHSGLYYCTARNQLGQHDSTPTHLNVLYPPRNTTVTSVSGDSIILLCSSDSNPMSSYTWYRKTQGHVILFRNSTNITLSSGEDGFYYCTARNGFGSSNSSEWLYTSDNRAVKYATLGVTVALILICTAIYLWIRRGEPPASSRSELSTSISNSAPVYDNISAMAMTSDLTHTESSEDQDEVQYSRVYFAASHRKEMPLYSTVQLPMALNQAEEVEYTTVYLPNPRAF